MMGDGSAFGHNGEMSNGSGVNGTGICILSLQCDYLESKRMDPVLKYLKQPNLSQLVMRRR